MDYFVNFDNLLDSGDFHEFIDIASKTPYKALTPNEKLLVTPYSRSRFIHLQASKKEVPKVYREGQLIYDKDCYKVFKLKFNEFNPTYNRGVYFFEKLDRNHNTIVALKLSTYDNLVAPIYDVVELALQPVESNFKAIISLI